MKSQARWLDLVTASLLLAVVVPIAYLPSWIAYPIGETLGRLAYLVDRRHRRVAAENLRLAFGSACGPDEIQTMTRAHFRSLGQTFVETWPSGAAQPSSPSWCSGRGGDVSGSSWARR